jgi:hypothetical protein
MLVDVLLLCFMVFVVPPRLAPFARSWSTLLASVAAFLLSLGFLWDGLRTWQRLSRADSN